MTLFIQYENKDASGIFISQIMKSLTKSKDKPSDVARPATSITRFLTEDHSNPLYNFQHDCNLIVSAFTSHIEDALETEQITPELKNNLRTALNDETKEMKGRDSLYKVVEEVLKRLIQVERDYRMGHDEEANPAPFARL